VTVPAGSGRAVADVEVVDDRTAGSPSDQGFLRVRRLVCRTVFADGGRSEPYACDVVSRAKTDAVAVVVYEVERPAGASPAPAGGRRAVRVALKTGVRPPVWLRRAKALAQPDPRPYGALAEVVAGMLEPEDVGPAGVERRAAIEALEEAGVRVDAARVRPLGAPSFPSPGVTDEKVHFRAIEASLRGLGPPAGDGSAMEAGGGVVVMGLREAIDACRFGDVPDLKTEVALLRLADAIGYVPALDRFVDELPADLRPRAAPAGLAALRP
jgi:ADP-ribose pyrophosphatase